MPEGALSGKVVVIVGATSGMGLSAARACLAAGARVVGVGPPEAPADAIGVELGPSARLVRGDARDPATARAAVRTAVDEFGTFDALYHVAGGSGRSFGDGALHEVSDAGWDETLRLNLTSVFYSDRAAVEQLRRQGGEGCVLNMASVSAFSPSPRHFGTHAYAAAKAAVIGLTRAAAARYAPDGIRFNALAPGLVETPMSRRALSDEQIRSYVERKQPLGGGRPGQPADVDGAAVFLLSDAARFVTGQVLAVDGGWSLTEAG